MLKKLSVVVCLLVAAGCQRPPARSDSPAAATEEQQRKPTPEDEARVANPNVATGGWPVPVDVVVPSDDRTMKSFMQAFGRRKANYLGMRNRLIGDQVWAAMVLREPERPLPGGNVMLWGCRKHSCDERAAAIVSPRQRLLAAGLLHYPCAVAPYPPPPGQAPCSMEDARLTIFVRKGDDRPIYATQLEAWAREQVQGMDERRLATIEKEVID